jgi:hypothetical protein
LIVDKTVTLTEGKPKLVDVLPSDGFEAQEFLCLAAFLEQHSEHPHRQKGGRKILSEMVLFCSQTKQP